MAWCKSGKKETKAIERCSRRFLDFVGINFPVFGQGLVGSDLSAHLSWMQKRSVVVGYLQRTPKDED
eukprot:864131-Amorphochlora_amoeboformis.AAC.1